MPDKKKKQKQGKNQPGKNGNKKEKDLSSDKEYELPLPFGDQIIWVKLRVVTGKKGRVKKARVTLDNGDFAWTHYNKDGKPTLVTGGGRGWNSDIYYKYDKKGRLVSSREVRKEGTIEKVTTRTYDPKNGKILTENGKPYIGGLH